MDSKKKWGRVKTAAWVSLLHSSYYSKHFVLTTAYCMWLSSPCYRGNAGVERSLHNNLRTSKWQSQDWNPDSPPPGATLLTPEGQHDGTEGTRRSSQHILFPQITLVHKSICNSQPVSPATTFLIPFTSTSEAAWTTVRS